MLLDAPVFLTVVTSEPAGEGDLVYFQAERLERAGGEEHLRTLERFAQPSSRLTLAQARTTGLTNQQLDEAPDLDEALQDLVEFSDGASAWVVADGAAVRESLKRAASRAGFPRSFGPPVAGADELGGLVLPTVCRRGVADLIAHYGLGNAPAGLRPDASAASAVAPASSPAVSPASPPAKAYIHAAKFRQTNIRDRGYLPHWTAEGSTYFVTWRLGDSLPGSRVEELKAECMQLVAKEAKTGLERTAQEDRRLNQLLSERIEAYLDAGVGECTLARPEVAERVKAVLHHFENQRYRLLAYCIMPNHVHVIFRPIAGHTMEDTLQSWKSFSAKDVNKVLGRKGTLWQREYYDHLIRDEDEYYGILEYVLQNPLKAGLNDWPWVWAATSSAPLAGEDAGDTAGQRPALQTASAPTAQGLAQPDSKAPTSSPAVAPASSRLSPALLRELWARLEADLLKVPLPVLAEMNWLLSKSPHPLKVLLKKAESSAVEAQFAQTFSSGKLSITSLYKDYSDLIKRLQPKGEEDSPDEGPTEAEPVAPGQAAELLGPVGPLAKSLPAYEHRREQIEMAERVAAAFGSGRHLLSEAGTGVGKSIAYLVPAILFAKQNERPVVVSTHTKNLQSQLFHKDIPLLKRALPVEFTAALLKGRPNYLCLRKFTYTLQEAAHELDEDERAALLPVMNWSTQTKDGDVAELAAFSPEQHPELWDRLHTVGEDCLSRACPFYHRCFVYKARAAARLADVVVCNHALVFADLNKENGSLPNYGEIVFDEAHTLEDVATEHLACEITPRRLYRILTKLFRAPQGSSAGKGLLPSLLFQLEMAKAEFPEPLFESIREHVLNAIQAVSPANAGSDVFFDSIRDWFERAQAQGDDDAPVSLHVPRERGRSPVQLDESGQADPFFSEPARAQRRPFAKPRGGAKAGDDRKRYSASTLRPEETDLFQEAKTSAISGLGRLRQTLDLLEEDFKEIKKRPVARARELHKELTAQNLFLQELISDLEFVVKSDEPNYVYWMEKLGRRAMRVVAAPLDLAAILHGQLYERKRSVVLTSATLSVRDAAADAGSGMAPLSPNVGQASRLSGSKPPPPAKPKPPAEEVAEFTYRRHLPHIRRQGAVYAITFRLADALPASRVEELVLAFKAIDGSIGFTEKQKAEKKLELSARLDDWLNAGSGRCWLAQPRVARLVKDALHHFDGERYLLHAWCVMPNHVHVLVEPMEAFGLSSILHSWKSFTSHEVGKIVPDLPDAFWQDESYDYIVRDEADFARCVEYILKNPAQANLSDWPWVGCSKAVQQSGAESSLEHAAFEQGQEHRTASADRRDACPTYEAAPPVPHKKSFEFLKHRLGLTLCEEGQVDELLEGSPFDYTKQCRLYLPVFLPPPESRDFNTGLSALVARLAVASQGRALVLYTSYASLNAGAAYLRKALAPEGIEVLAQGEDGSREALLAKLKAGGRSVLLGTASFWEGVDVPGDALSLLIIAKLPFQVFTDPIIQGRCELLEAQGKDPFLHFSVPNAILKLRQGFGRLIRTKSDRGIVVLCDKRVLTKRYGPAFLRALPAQARQAHDADALAEEIGEFLAPGSV